MDNQDHVKNHTSGHDGNGVHICHKCGWPFPNPHPSARHRRAHKKICGTIDGYKLVDSQGSALSTLSDDERLSDEDQKTPSPQILERTKDEKKSAGSGLRTIRSEDEAFVDAVAEFSDSGSGKGIEGSSDDIKKPARSIETSLTNVTKTALPLEDDAITAVVPPSRNFDSSQHADSQGNMLSADALESKIQPSHVTIGSVVSSVTDCRTEESDHGSSDDKYSSTCDRGPIQVESQVNVSQENMKNRAREDVAVIDVMVNKDHNKKWNAVDDLVETDIKRNEKAIQTSEAVPFSSKTEYETSDNVATARFIESEEQGDDDLDSKNFLNVPSSEVDSIGLSKTYFGSTQINAAAPGRMASEGSGKLTEMANEQGEENDNFHVFSVSDEMPVLKNPEIMIEGYKDHRAGTKLQLVDADSFEVMDISRDSTLIVNPSNSFSSLSAEGKELFASGDISKDKIPLEDGNSEHFKDSVCKVNPSSSSSLSDEGKQLYASDTRVSGYSIQQEGGDGENVVEKYSGETEPLKEAVNEGQITEESCVLKDAAANEVDKVSTAQCPQEQLPDDYPHVLSQSVSSEHGTSSKSDMALVAASVDVEVRQVSGLVVMNDAVDCESSRCDTTKCEEVKGIAEDSCFGKIMAAPENFGILSKGKVHERIDFSEGKNATDDGKGKVESNYGSEIETMESDFSLGSVDGSTLMNTAMTPEVAKDFHETIAASKNVVNASEINISEPELLILNKASYCQGSAVECGTNDKGKVLVEDSAAGVSDNGGDNDGLRKSVNNAGNVRSDKIDVFEVSQKFPEEQTTKESELSPLNVSYSIQNDANAGDNPARDFLRAGPDNQAESCPVEGENKLVAQQLGASATDFSVDSSSQTDSLEGHWGSVSVLSTPSDVQATADMEPVAHGSKASAEAEKADMKKPKTSTEGAQLTERSDIFEPPSFMTLVEPRGGDNVASADEIRTAQNLQQPKDGQAGWFPSLSNVVNESQGRKKNEEIIAKVTNWSTARQNAPLKNLLTEANAENRSKLPSPKENQPSEVQKDEPKRTVVSPQMTAKPTASPQMTLPEPVKKDETGKDWDSPARYPADIRREKRKVKGRPYWAQFMCCSSVN